MKKTHGLLEKSQKRRSESNTTALKVIVQDAGTPKANRTYVYIKTCSNEEKYIIEGAQEDQKQTFTLNTCDDAWCISIFDEDEEHEKICFYFAKDHLKKLETLPKIGLKCLSRDKPAPKYVLYLFSSNEDDKE